MRGKIENRERKKQIIDFSKLRWGNITPTDGDGFVDFNKRLFVYLEYKLVGADLPFGQRLALSNQCEIAESGGCTAIALVLEHDTNPSEDIEGDSPVRELWYKGEWRPPTRPITCKEAIDILREAALL